MVNRSKLGRITSQAGQMTTEMILIMAALLLMTFAFSQVFKDEELVQSLVKGPWRHLSGMLQNGVWEEPQRSMDLHPTQHERHSSLKGDEGSS